MCGLTGLFDRAARQDQAGLEGRVRAMTSTLVHRGPDDGGAWADAEAGIALGHRRLAIVDLSPAGHQPMVSADGRWVIAYNGEIYNFGEVGAELRAAGREPAGGSDTAVLLEACAAWGPRAAAERCNGMFAFALWDRRERVLTLARDRLGIKPMHWARFGELILFGSELRALRAAGGWEPEIDPGAVAAFLRFAYVPAPATIFRGVHKLPPGCLLTVPREGEPRVERYWDLARVAVDGQADPLDLDAGGAADELERLLLDAVGRQMVSDVPLGAFLSGGIDSSTVVALMQAQADRPVRSFSIGFRERGYDESPHARAVAAHLGTEHTELTVTPSDALAVVPDLGRLYDEPFADSSQVPTLLLSRLTRGHVTVALSGDGGDELFCGYNRYASVPALWRRIGRIPRPARRGAALALGLVGPAAWEAVARLLPARRRHAQLADKARKALGAMTADGPDAIYRHLVAQWQDPLALVRAPAEAPSPVFAEPPPGLPDDPVLRMQYLDALTYLPDDILTKVDRASMAVGLEVRVPLLDHRVVEFAWRLPRRLQVEGDGGKAALRRVLYRHVPREIMDRPKMGFSVPLGPWLRGPLRDWAESLLSEASLAEGGLLDPAPIRRAWADHVAGRAELQHPLWAILMLQSWRASGLAATRTEHAAAAGRAPRVAGRA
jgi:asparagine synthase (glutamine-hydrolysing)